jgi:hypothetical protein
MTLDICSDQFNVSGGIGRGMTLRYGFDGFEVVQ